MMNKIWIAGCLMACVAQSAFAQTAFTVKGDLKDDARDTEKATMSYFNGTNKVYRSVAIKNGKFEIEGTITNPTLASLSIATTKKMREKDPWTMSEKCTFFIEGGIVTVDGKNVDSAIVKSAGKSQEDYLRLQALLKPFHKKEVKAFSDMIQAAIDKDSVARIRHLATNARAKQEMDSVELVFLKKNPRSHVTLELMRDRVTAQSLATEKDKLKGWFNALPDSLKATAIGKQLDNQIKMAYKLGPGNPSQDFTLNDTLGNPIKLSAYRGKYVLLDFWASWCIPCRHENPVVKKAFERFKDKNFTVLSVSLEKPGDRKAWVDAIQKDRLTWPQVATMTEAERTNVSTLYSIQSIPMNYLIDPKGKIVAVYLRGDALINKLEEILL